MPNSFKTRLRKLVVSKKLILIGSVVTIISVFLPWYSDIDKFKIGDSFLGITGPLYLAGFLVFVAGVVSFGLIVMQLLDKKLPKLPLSESSVHLFNCVLSFLMLVIASSVYFHAKFGINLIDKSAGIGLILAFIGTGVILLGTMLSLKQKDVSFEEEGHLEPLITLDDREPSGIVEPEVKEEIKKPVAKIAFDDVPSFNRDVTVEEAQKASHLPPRPEVPDPPTKAWSQVQESIEKLSEDTKDIQ